MNYNFGGLDLALRPGSNASSAVEYSKMKMDMARCERSWTNVLLGDDTGAETV